MEILVKTKKADGKPTKRGLKAAAPLNKLNGHQAKKGGGRRTTPRFRVVSYFAGCGGWIWVFSEGSPSWMPDSSGNLSK